MAMSDQPVRCSDCRFCVDSGIKRCINPEAKSYFADGEPMWARCADMRDSDGACGRDAKLFERPLPKTAGQKFGCLLLFIAVAAALYATVHFIK